MSTSPILHGDKLILVLDDERNMPGGKLSRSKIICLNKATGEPLWETPRPFNRSGWSTPTIWAHEGGTELVVLDVAGFPLRRRWYVSHREGKRLSRAAQLFLRYLQEEGEAEVTHLLALDQAHRLTVRRPQARR